MAIDQLSIDLECRCAPAKPVAGNGEALMSDEIRVEVTWDDINRSRHPDGSPRRCPIVRALDRQHIPSQVGLGGKAILTAQGAKYDLPLAAQMFIARFDNDYPWRRNPRVKPFSFVMTRNDFPQPKWRSFQPWSESPKV